MFKAISLQYESCKFISNDFIKNLLDGLKCMTGERFLVHFSIKERIYSFFCKLI